MCVSSSLSLFSFLSPDVKKEELDYKKERVVTIEFWITRTSRDRFGACLGAAFISITYCCEIQHEMAQTSNIQDNRMRLMRSSTVPVADGKLILTQHKN